MSAIAYSDHYSLQRRYARQQFRQSPDLPAKTVQVLRLVQGEPAPQLVKLVERSYKKSAMAMTLLAVVLLHATVFVLLPKHTAIELPIIQAEIPPMTVQLYRPPVQPPVPEVIKELPAPPKPEKPKPVVKPEVVAKAKPVVKQQAPIQQKSVPAEPVVAQQPLPVVAPVVQAPAEISPATAEPGYLQNPAPVYPDFAMEQGWEGTVLLNVHVLGSGKPDLVELKQSSGRKVLDTAAINTVKGWAFVPAKQGEAAIDSWVEVPIEFSLSNG